MIDWHKYINGSGTLYKALLTHSAERGIKNFYLNE